MHGLKWPINSTRIVQAAVQEAYEAGKRAHDVVHDDTYDEGFLPTGEFLPAAARLAALPNPSRQTQTTAATATIISTAETAGSSPPRAATQPPLGLLARRYGVARPPSEACTTDIFIQNECARVSYGMTEAQRG